MSLPVPLRSLPLPVPLQSLPLSIPLRSMSLPVPLRYLSLPVLRLRHLGVKASPTAAKIIHTSKRINWRQIFFLFIVNFALSVRNSRHGSVALQETWFNSPPSSWRVTTTSIRTLVIQKEGGIDSSRVRDVRYQHILSHNYSGWIAEQRKWPRNLFRHVLNQSKLPSPFQSRAISIDCSAGLASVSVSVTRKTDTHRKELWLQWTTDEKHERRDILVWTIACLTNYSTLSWPRKQRKAGLPSIGHWFWLVECWLKVVADSIGPNIIVWRRKRKRKKRKKKKKRKKEEERRIWFGGVNM